MRLLAGQLREGIKRHRQVPDEIFHVMAVVKAALEKERTLFGELIKSRFSKADERRVEKIKERVEKEMEESRAKSRAAMEKYGIEPDETGKT